MFNRNKQKLVLLMIIFISQNFFSCAENPPIYVDGQGTLELVVLWDSTYSGSTTAVPVENAKVIVSSKYLTKIYQTDHNGKLSLNYLPTSVYGYTVRKSHPIDPNIILVGSKQNIEIVSGQVVFDTIYVKPISSTGISINEIYCAGPVNNFFFFFDQFIELYNASDSVRYLDGMMIMRFSSNTDGKGPGADEDDDNDIDGATYVFKFPGKPGETNYPIFPKQFIVLASDAVDHRNVCATSYDLSNADWEFYNQYSPEDIDNPNVPNLINMRSDKTADFLIALTSDVIILSDGRDSAWQDGIDINTIVDGIEYQTNPPPQNKKTLDPRVDRSYVLSPPRYSGKSMQRREPGLDTNDSLSDFEILDRATPGYFK
ncbi:MAG: DUF4876 domain-containing protein [Ignavibacteria bacterium]